MSWINAPARLWKEAVDRGYVFFSRRRLASLSSECCHAHITLKNISHFQVLIHPGTVKSTGFGDVPVRRGSVLRVTEDVLNAVTPRTSETSNNSRGDSKDVEHESRKLECGYDLLDNNAVNLLMATIMSIGGMALASYIWNVPLQTVWN